jgi:hypothetical protein
VTARGEAASRPGTSEAFDVVIVPDFSGAAGQVFEARTLFFLASWLEHAGTARSFPLHLACIGEPPASVRWMAERCGAELSLHEPLGLESSGTSNKLRGLEVQGRTDRLLLLDADVLVLGDISGLGELGSCIAAGPPDKPRLSKRHWQIIYPALGMPPPAERCSSVLGELLAPGYQHPRLTSMVPFYNSGVLFLPWDCGLRPLWEEHIGAIAAQFSEDDERWRWLGANDEAGLATAVELLKQRGVPFVRLPDVYHTRWLHVHGGAVRWSDVKLFHALGFFRTSRPWTTEPASIAREISSYCRANEEEPVARSDGFAPMVRRDRERSIEFARELEAELHRLLGRHVAPALQHADARV